MTRVGAKKVVVLIVAIALGLLDGKPATAREGLVRRLFGGRACRACVCNPPVSYGDVEPDPGNPDPVPVPVNYTVQVCCVERVNCQITKCCLSINGFADPILGLGNPTGVYATIEPAKVKVKKQLKICTSSARPLAAIPGDLLPPDASCPHYRIQFECGNCMSGVCNSDLVVEVCVEYGPNVKICVIDSINPADYCKSHSCLECPSCPPQQPPPPPPKAP